MGNRTLIPKLTNLLSYKSKEMSFELYLNNYFKYIRQVARNYNIWIYFYLLLFSESFKKN